MRKMTRSLAAATVATAAFAGLAFAGAAPAGAASASAGSAKCEKYAKEARAHLIAGDRYKKLAQDEKAKAHPNWDKVKQYSLKADDETRTGKILLDTYERCMNS
ncbi:hypothetical protein AB0I10_15225 [Streptomyces sp. NPDC050636]|uniref:hypothetical protein n=1 Tax=Streptomyces sp. NPDC050636 TaxID=3154510 RepID=UPI0034305C0D